MTSGPDNPFMAVAFLLAPDLGPNAFPKNGGTHFLQLRSSFISVDHITIPECKRKPIFITSCSINKTDRSFYSLRNFQGCGNWTFKSVLAGTVKALGLLKKPVITALLIGVLLMGDFELAMAASGGRMGGESFSSRSSSSSGSYCTEWTSPSLSHPLPWYGSSPFHHGTNSGICLAPSVRVGVSSNSRLLKVMMGVTTAMFLYGFLCDRPGTGRCGVTSEKTTIIKLQVGLLGSDQSLQRDFDHIAKVSNTSTSKGLHYILTETTLALLRHRDYWVSAYSSNDVKGSVEDGEKGFNRYCIEERGKFEEETLVNVDNLRKQSKAGSRPRLHGFCNEYIVVTMIAAVDGAYKLPIINSSYDLNAALQCLGSVSLSKLQAVEVLWTPQDENDMLPEQEFLEKYPLLRSI